MAFFSINSKSKASQSNSILVNSKNIISYYFSNLINKFYINFTLFVNCVIMNIK